MIPRARYFAFGGAGVLAVLGIWAARSGKEQQRPPDVGPTPDAEVIAWCAPGLEPIPGGGCFAPAAEGTPAPAPLLVYLHGRYDRAKPEEELDRQKRLASRASARGVAVLALRGREGQCVDPELAAWFCWPASERTAGDAAAFVTAWEPALRHAEARTGGPRYVLGFSNGGFFTSILASRALFPADAFVIAHAGPIDPMRPTGKTPPVLLLSADDDEATQNEMLRLDDILTREKWPHESVAREGGHALTDRDIDVVLSFLTRVRKERLPLKPPLSTHVPRARDPKRVVEAGVTDAEPMLTPTPSPSPSPTPIPIPTPIPTPTPTPSE